MTHLQTTGSSSKDERLNEEVLRRIELNRIEMQQLGIIISPD